MAVQHDSPLGLDELFRCLREHRMIETEACARREYRSFVTPSADTNASLVNGIDVEDYYAIFAGLTDFVSQSPYQIELTQFLFPVFVHLYFNLLENGRLDECRHFYAQFIRCTPLESLHGHFFYQLRLISHSSTHLDRSPLMRTMRASRFFLRLSMTSCTAIQTFMDATKSHSKSNLTATQISLLLAICQQCLKVDVNKQVFSPCTVVRYQTTDQPMTPLFVHTTVADAIRFTRLYTGIFPLQSAGPIDHLIAVPCASAYPQINYNRLPNSAEGNPVPRLGPHQLPCICMFTLKSAKQLINCVTLSDDCHLLAIGCQSSEILVCSLNPNKTLHSMKSARDLRSPATERCNERVLIGHTSAIFTLAFQPDKRMYLLSGSQDCTLRLWHLSTWTCLVVYRMHSQPILDGKFHTRRCADRMDLHCSSCVRLDRLDLCVMQYRRSARPVGCGQNLPLPDLSRAWSHRSDSSGGISSERELSRLGAQRPHDSSVERAS